MSSSHFSNRQVSERELAIPTLEAMAKRPDGFIPTSELISELTLAFRPSGHDAEIAAGRRDTYFSQKVRNMVSHRDCSTSFIKKGYATYLKERNGFLITDEGRTQLMNS
ncbi:hypothetical protein UAJ10_21300 [Nitrospirillum sp. BR 11164]|uniref:hypothetical protein n=1 Tax=Nitrospirillum sp. BR 11164 TaxID=3104324 RepID=UPI002AFE9E57|nr:hypothetical protein [Nitrospirillum sp. BR 11164]MEA1651536.1 hypothetical protein [Nitrospirillum sp. BR 11164]